MTDPSFYIFGLILFCLSYFSFYLKGDSRALSFAICLAFALLTTFRSTSVPDTSEYIEFFSLYNLDITDFQYLGHEPGFIILGKLTKILADDYRAFFFAITIINLTLVYRALVNFKLNPALGLVLYISFYGIYYNFIFLRSGLASSVLIYSISVIHSGFLKRGALSLAAAPLFHASIVLHAALLPILAKPLKKPTLNLLIAFSVLIYLSGATDRLAFGILNYIGSLENLSRYRYYIENMKFDTGLSTRFLMNCLIAVGVINLTKNYTEIEKFARFTTFGLLMGSVFSSFLWVDRISDAFVVFIFLLLAAFSSGKNRSHITNHAGFLLVSVHIVSNLFFISRISTTFFLE